jgi:tryptophan-rich sensory protein
MSGMKRPLLLFTLLMLSFGTLAIGGWLTSLGLGAWYDALRVPDWQPPPWVFTPAWITILSLLAIASWRVFAQQEKPRGVAIGLYALQLLLNMGWSLLFFALQSPPWALVEILVLNVAVLAMVVVYYRIDRPAGLMIVPYAAWLGLATAINVWIVANNG